MEIRSENSRFVTVQEILPDIRKGGIQLDVRKTIKIHGTHCPECQNVLRDTRKRIFLLSLPATPVRVYSAKTRTSFMILEQDRSTATICSLGSRQHQGDIQDDAFKGCQIIPGKAPFRNKCPFNGFTEIKISGDTIWTQLKKFFREMREGKME
ncbi:MAG: hypothetical protein PHH70_02925 [Candidatus Gracilibacteria bacterium]|nr:hypothetical protein [Candidatus Gracilibacteria bacterium]